MPALHLLLAETNSPFAFTDWFVLVGYLALVVLIGLLAARKRREGDDYFLAGRTMPMWAVAISVLATAQSAATFVGGPQQAYAGDLTYLASNLGPLIAAIIVAFFFIPAFYRHNVTSVYELIGHEMGSSAQRLASGMFMLGRVFASGARLFIVAIPFALLAFGDLEPKHMAISIILITIVATLYSIAGGIRAVIWTDVMQVIVYLTCITIALVLIWQKIPVPASEMMDALRTADDGNKLTIIDFSFDLTNPFTIWSIVLGVMLLNLAAYGADQDLTQRMLTCKSPKQASWSVITATLIGFPVVFIFLAMGLLLFIYYQQPELMGAAAPDREVLDSRRVFIDFIFHEMPIGVRGLMMAGLFAAAMSSLDSGLNAMSSTTIADFVRPWRAKRNPHAEVGDKAERRAGRAASLFWACMIGGFALLCIVWYDPENETLIVFALGVMTFAYSGLLGVFFCAIFLKRGNAASAVAALLVGFVSVLMMDPVVWEPVTFSIGLLMYLSQWLKTEWGHAVIELQPLAFSWRLLIAAALSTIVCAVSPRKT